MATGGWRLAFVGHVQQILTAKSFAPKQLVCLTAATLPSLMYVCISHLRTHTYICTFQLLVFFPVSRFAYLPLALYPRAVPMPFRCEFPWQVLTVFVYAAIFVAFVVAVDAAVHSFSFN